MTPTSTPAHDGPGPGDRQSGKHAPTTGVSPTRDSSSDPSSASSPDQPPRDQRLPDSAGAVAARGHESRVVILAAGKGTRMNSELPKVLCSVADRPMIHFVIDAVEKAGIREKIVVVGYEAQQVQAVLAERNDEHLHFALQAEQLGTGHAVQMCHEHLAGRSGLTLVIAGDSPLIQADSLARLIEHFWQTRPALLLGTLEKDDPTGLGRIVRDDAGQFTGIVEHKDATDAQRAIREVNMSTYLFANEDLLWALAQLSNDNAQGEFYLTDCARILYQAGRGVEASPLLQPCESLSINNPAELQLVDQTMRAMGYA